MTVAIRVTPGLLVIVYSGLVAVMCRRVVVMNGGLADFLGCGNTKAQNIMNSGILQERDIAYRAGNRWRFNKVLLIKLLQEEPEILNKPCSEAA